MSPCSLNPSPPTHLALVPLIVYFLSDVDRDSQTLRQIAASKKPEQYLIFTQGLNGNILQKW